jgi:hypothetical protein
MHGEIGALRTEARVEIRRIRPGMRSQFRWLLGIITIIVVVLFAHAALWQQMSRLDSQMTAIGAQVGEIATMLRQRTGG